MVYANKSPESVNEDGSKIKVDDVDHSLDDYVSPD